MRAPALVDLVSEASRRNVCWKIGCTTCGASELRSGIRLLARHVPLRLAEVAPDDPPALLAYARPPELVPWSMIERPTRPLTPREAENLTTICAEASLKEVAADATFPDWLGYLGMILCELERFEHCRYRIGVSWSQQFVHMGGNREAWSRFEARPIWATDLERAEQERLGAVRLRSPRRRGL